ncbi:MAG TPA: lytic transglycosylase domain-containing protein [Acetobacteraceae bacterium]|nr:lytic transglycosylase domain-containing protein [Acetobacteraceae bacterium]
MLGRMRLPSLVWGLALLLAAPAVAQPRVSGARDSGAAVMAAVRADRWPEAEIAAANYVDPVARKLVAYYRVLAPHAASAAEIAAFMAANPDWPLHTLLARRLDEAIAAEPDDSAAAALCRAHPPAAAATLERCAQALGSGPEATAMARAAWVDGDAGVPWEVAFVLRWGSVLRPEDERARFDALARRDTAAATRQATRLTGDDRLAALARLALRTNAPNAATVLAAVPAARRGDPLLVYEHAAWLRRAGQDAAALAVWLAAPPAPVPASWQPTLWRERDVLARQLLQAGDASGAYKLVAAHGQTGGEPRLDAEFLAGFIALRKLHDPAAAAPHFRALMAGSHSAITLARGHYWLARASADPATAKAEYSAAAAWPNTFYGQLAILALGEGDAGLQRRILALHDPAATPSQALDFAGRELARAAALLTGWGEPRRAQAFLLRLERVAPDPADRALSARLATGLGLPQTAVFIARRAGAQGLMLLDSGWPAPVSVPPDAGLPPALVLGLIRQESSFDTAVVSPSGARGLMQLMPGTAKDVARDLGAPATLSALTLDGDYNMRLGTHYLRAMLDRFGGCTPLAIAAYNAGPSRVQQWLAANGDPCHPGGVDMIDWLEQIPFSETRNYVQRVTENAVLYAARDGVPDTAPTYLLAKWLP